MVGVLFIYPTGVGRGSCAVALLRFKFDMKPNFCEVPINSVDLFIQIERNVNLFCKAVYLIIPLLSNKTPKIFDEGNVGKIPIFEAVRLDHRRGRQDKAPAENRCRGIQ